MIQLLQFGRGDACAAVGDESDDALAEPAPKSESFHEQVIADDDRLDAPEALVQRDDAPPELGVVIDVVVDERGGVDQLESERQRHDVLIILTPGEFVGEHHQHRTPALATCEQHMLRQLHHRA